MAINLKNPANRQYLKRFAVTMTSYMVSIFGVGWAFPRYHPAGPLAYVLAVLPAIAIIGVIVSAGMYIAEEKDEFQRNLLIQSMIWAIGATLSITTVWGFLQMYLDVHPIQLWLIFPLFAFFVGVATCLLKLRYR